MDWCSIYLTPQDLPKYIYLSSPSIFPTTSNGIRTKNHPMWITPGAAPIRWMGPIRNQVNAASIHGRLISIWKFECMKSSFCPTFVYMLLFHVHLPCFGDILIWLNHSKTHRTICSKVFHIWHSDPYMDRLRPSREYT
jgi:hypothetical protein